MTTRRRPNPRRRSSAGGLVTLAVLNGESVDADEESDEPERLLVAEAHAGSKLAPGCARIPSTGGDR